MIVTPAIQHEYQIEKLIDLLVEAEDLEWQYVPGEEYDRLRQDAIMIIEAEEQGKRMGFQMIVILYESDLVFPTDEGRWRYRAIPAAHANGMPGCPHEIEATSFRWAAAQACAEHRRTCVNT